MPLPIAELGPRITIIGGSCSGKSTMAKELGDRLGLPVFHLDQIKWEAGQAAVERPESVFMADLERWVAQDSWIIEGCYKSALPQILPRTTAVVHLRPGRVIALKRYLTRLKSGRQLGVADGDVPPFLWAMVRWIMWDYPRNREPAIKAMLRIHSRVYTVR